MDTINENKLAVASAVLFIVLLTAINFLARSSTTSVQAPSNATSTTPNTSTQPAAGATGSTVSDTASTTRVSAPTGTPGSAQSAPRPQLGREDDD